MKTTFHSSGSIKILSKTTSDYRLINDYAFSSAVYRLTKKHITVEESTTTFSNSTLCINTTTPQPHLKTLKTLKTLGVHR